MDGMDKIIIVLGSLRSFNFEHWSLFGDARSDHFNLQ